ncbi:MAG: L,D-transpeptidase family protein [Pseudomonadota bacterium]
MSGFHPYFVKIRFLVLGFFLCALLVNPEAAVAREDFETALRRLLKDQIELSPPEWPIVCRGRRICGAIFIPPFYALRAYRPAWISGDALIPQAAQLISVIEAVGNEGLRPGDYHLDQLKELMTMASTATPGDRNKTLDTLRDLDLLLTDAFLLLGAHLLNGRVNPETLDPTYATHSPETDLAAKLKDALEKGDIAATLSSLAPPRDGYRRMKKVLADYRKLSELPLPPPVPSGPSLKLGDRDHRISAVNDRLVFWGDKPKAPRPVTPELFDPELDKALRRFQRRHGIEADGVLGKMTLAALNFSASERLSQVEINMERWRWIPHQLGTQYILVNTADYSLKLVAGLETLLEMRVVVGRPEQLTPVLSGEINYVVINPYWHVPHSIAVRDILPKLRKNPTYLREHHIAVLEGWGENAPKISPESVDWTAISEHNFRYKLRQEPGPKNSLGRIKFLFPNKFGVYLHDTPSRGLFKRAVRGFSSGCIRIEKPMDLAAYLLRDKPGWDHEAIKAQVESGQTRTIPVNPAMPVHLLYWTAWVDENDIVQFREDIYGRDNGLKSALSEKPPMLIAEKKITWVSP